jgi:hypothetical protein
MDNLTFLRSIGVQEDKQQQCLETMAKYGDNHWWEPDVDPREYAYYQIQEPILLGDFSHFHTAIELLLSRPVFTHEFALNNDALIQEASRAWTYQVGVTSDQERNERVQASIRQLEQFAADNGKEILHIDPQGE